MSHLCVFPRSFGAGGGSEACVSVIWLSWRVSPAPW